MTLKTELLARFSGAGRRDPLYLPDLTLWYSWHQRQGTLPDEWKGYSLPEIARDMGVPIWLTARPWRVATPNVEVRTEQTDTARATTYETETGALTSRWALGPDGDWWQTEHLVKSRDDLPAARALAADTTYHVDQSNLADLEAQVGDDGVVALELPRRPYSDLLHDYVGWGNGLLLLMGKENETLLEIADLLEAKLQDLTRQVAELPSTIILAPDNLDGQYISPKVFRKHWTDSYRETADVLGQQGKHLAVHAGGPVQRLLQLLVAAGVDGVEGISGSSLAQARELAGSGITLWGGIPQDLLIPPHSGAEFETGVIQATRDAQGDSRCLLGVADRVPTTANLNRLLSIPSIIDKAIA